MPSLPLTEVGTGQAVGVQHVAPVPPPQRGDHRLTRVGFSLGGESDLTPGPFPGREGERWRSWSAVALQGSGSGVANGGWEPGLRLAPQ